MGIGSVVEGQMLWDSDRQMSLGCKVGSQAGT